MLFSCKVIHKLNCCCHQRSKQNDLFFFFFSGLSGFNLNACPLLAAVVVGEEGVDTAALSGVWSTDPRNIPVERMWDHHTTCLHTMD